MNRLIKGGLPCTLRALICNPPVYVQKFHMSNGLDVAFKKDPSAKNMKETFIKEAVTVKTSSLIPRSQKSDCQILCTRK